jgi:RNA polymerase sigma factor (sigma-70 family)
MEFFESHSSINALAKRFQKGDAKAAEKLFNYFYPAIFRYIKSRTRSVETAEDVAQDVFLKVAKSIRLFDIERGNFTAWIWQIVRNVFTDHLRKSGRKLEDPASAYDIDPDTYPSETKATAKSDDSDMDRVLNIVKKYSEEEQELFRMRYIAGMNYEDIAAILDRSVNAVTVASHRIREKVKKDLHDDTI